MYMVEQDVSAASEETLPILLFVIDAILHSFWSQNNQNARHARCMVNCERNVVMANALQASIKIEEGASLQYNSETPLRDFPHTIRAAKYVNCHA